ncbi:MAG: uracil-DNA glycosylase [Fibrobacteres bacterium]|nr:uracil-DNA glycosylase [Fibrobacterota bacterium]
MKENTAAAETESRVDPKMDPSWKDRLSGEFRKPYFTGLKHFLKEEKRNGAVIYPPGPLIFNAFNKTPFDAVKVVILGQDPYHGPGQAHGLCFSVQPGVKPPPSLVNIFKELRTDVGFRIPDHGNLEKWAEQGVLLLNACLTVRAGSPGSHHGKGWEEFTSAAVKVLNDEKKDLVFLLWGKPAQVKGAIIDPKRHHVLTAAHPSPFSADRGFFGTRHFSKTNAILEKSGRDPIDWQI